ncbi:MAG: hypothetical protein E7C50_10355 [Clostridium sp.]|uniref:hypothetical protein n=1 Tax=Clostridium sp. TaxID=1506 RepID=UPI0029032D02|nr:hypothetical protein [Clostridium sp.]MDU2682277.1 hypothetical protein [Clostridium sp.]MDU8967162.1 hypothetical protein [Clostridium sp.]
MKIRKKKKGSTFVTVVVVMAIIFTTGTTILAVTANDYNMRINQSKKLQNLYEADSGLDVVENIIIKTSQEAIKYADKEVKKKFTELDDKDRSKDKINEIFKDKFYEFLTVRNKEILNQKEVEILEYLILEKKYIKSILESGKLEYDSAISNIENRFIIEIPEGGYVKNINNGKVSNITIEVKSNFESTEGQLKNKKTVSTKYSITAPDYNSEITSINIYPVFDGKAITADGNMNIESLGNKSIVNISGDIWVQGNNNLGNSPEYTFDKYIGGIKLDNTSFDINGNIYTANTFHLNNLVNESSVNGDIYAKNIYIGKSINSNVSKLNNISFEKNVVVNNDLALNATNSSIVIKNNFYGINEKTTEVSTANKALSSSSIIVNDTSNTSTITVNKDSYIMGVAYLNATDESGNKYQTGESVAVKGNYLAYTDVDDVLNGATNVTLKYYSPLQLLESKNGQSNAIMKADYFAEYYSKNNNSYNFNDGGVSLKKSVKSVGASVKDNQGNIQKSNINDSDISIVNEQRNEFARNVFAMGDTTGLGYDLYDGQEVKRQVSNQVNFNEIRRVQGSSFDTTEGMVILKGNENENIEIENGKIKGTDIELSKGLIIANGDITIDGNFNFTGNIITTGNIILKGEGEKNITYDPQVVRSILALNYDLLKDIFVKSQGDREEVKVTSASELYSVDKFLTKSLWRIVK